MNPLQAAPNPLLSLTKASPLAAHAKAQKLRVHAQGTRAEPSRAEFGDKLKRHAADKPERSEDAARKGKAEESPAAETVKPASIEAGGDEPRARGNEEAKVETTPQAGTKPSAEGADLREVEKVVAEVLQGVDPVLKLRPSAVARREGTVAGHAAEAKKQISVERQPKAAVETPAVAEAEAPASAAQEPLQPVDGMNLDQALPGAEERAPSGRSNADESTGGGKEKGPEPRAGAAQRAVERAAPIVLPAAMSFDGEPDAGPLPVVSGVQAGGAKGEKAAPAAPPAPMQPRATLAEQVERGLQVAMHELPAPAGERIVTLRLHPSALGSLRIAMQVSGDSVSIRFQVGSAKAKAAIGKAVDDLKASIARQGLRISLLEIEEESALAAPAGTEPRPGAQEAVGKGFAIGDQAPPAHDAAGAGDESGRMPGPLDPDDEGGVLQVLTFRLDAVG